MKRHIILTSHPTGGRMPPPMVWGASTAAERGPLIAQSDKDRRNVIGAHAGTFAIYRALAITAGKLSPIHVPDLTNTAPAEKIGPNPQWSGAEKIVSLDPWGHLIAEVFADRLKEGWDIRPTIAITKAHIEMPELKQAIDAGRLVPDNKILLSNGAVRVTKAAIEPVWFLPGIAQRFGVSESDLRQGLFEHTGRMFAELVTRPDLKVFLPPIGGTTVYWIGDIAALGDRARKVACRVHDECNGSDVFGSDICTCRPYLAHGVEVCVATAQQDGVGIVVYNRKEGRGLGEVTKFLVYNARKRQEGGDRAATYFERTECIAGLQDMRFQELMPDVLHWLGVTRIDRFVSMSDAKFQPLVKSGIEVIERVEIPEGLIRSEARVEIDAKKAAGYFTKRIPDSGELKSRKGRLLEE
ncbi:MAG TPA: GTP cyclohydrolase II [Stellaceae bacterium]|nr:GTP cyclohydrolase II [Stellaceae bacterium]